MKDFGKRLYYEREAHAWSQEQVAEMVGTSAPTVSRWERGITFPNPYFRQKLCGLYRKSAEELGFVDANGTGERPSPRQKTDTETAFVSLPVPTWILCNLPYPRNTLFVGRDKILRQIHHMLQTDKSTGLFALALCGLAGMGKTQVVIEYAYCYGHEYQSILWIRATTREVLFSELASIAEMLEIIKQEEQNEQQLVKAIQDWLYTQSSCLVIFDNVEEISLVHELFPLKGQSHIILTTRSQATGPFVQRINLEKLELEEGALLLLRRTKYLCPTDLHKQIAPEEHSIALEIAGLMDGLPLALDQAGAYIEEAGCSLSNYLALFRSRRATLLSMRNLRADLNSDSPHSVSTTLALAFERVKQNNLAAFDLLCFCSFLHPDLIYEEMITTGTPDPGFPLQEMLTDSVKFDAALAELLKHSLIRRNSETKTLIIHRLVQVVLKDKLDEEVRQQWARRAIEAISRVFPEADCFATSSPCRRYLPHAQFGLALLEESAIESLEAGQLLKRLGMYYYELAEYSQAEELCKKAITILNQVVEPEHPEIANTYQILCRILCIRARYTEAEQFCQQALAIYQKQPEPDYFDIACCLGDLADIHLELQQYTLAESLYQKILEMNESFLDPQHRLLATDLCNLGRCYLVQGKYLLAKPVLERSLSLRQQALGAEHPHTAISLHRLGQLYLEQGQLSQSETLLKQALSILQRELGPKHHRTAEILRDLAKLHHTRAGVSTANGLLQTALDIFQKTLGKDHPQVLRLLQQLDSLNAVESLE